MLDRCDIVVVCLDPVDGRMMLNDCCMCTGKLLIQADIFGNDRSRDDLKFRIGILKEF